MFTKKPIPLLLFLLFLWIGAMSWVGHTNGCCNPMPGLLIGDSGKTVASSANNFHFGLGGAKALDIGTVNPEMQKVANYLKANPGKKLNLTGQYKSDEKNTSTFDNLGLGRADNIKGYLIGLGAPAAQIFTGSKLVNGLSFNKDDKTYEGIIWGFEDVKRSISFIDGEAHSNINDKDDFAFATSSFDHITPIGADLKTTVGKTAEYLKKSGRNMRITGYYMEGEKNTGALSNLGLARANNIKKVFTDLGVPSKQLEIASAVKELFFFKGEATEAATYDFSGDAPDNRLAEVEARLRANPLVLYFATNESNLNLSTTQRQYLTDLIYYLDKKDGASVNSTGHTDNVGNRANNTRLGRKRAEFVRNYLKRNNINESKVKTASKGPDSPTATNDTKEGRAKNRRVEISIN